jgi:hypothetical protein
VPDEVSLMPQIVVNCVPRVVVTVASWKYDYANPHKTFELFFRSNNSSSLFPGGPPFLYRRLAIAFLEGRNRNGSHKLLLAMVIEFNDDVIVIARDYGAEPKLSVLDLGTLSECRFACHDYGFPST